MESALAWIGQIADSLLSLFPKWEIVRANEAGVKFVRGKKAKLITPGLCPYWPAVTVIETTSTAQKTINLESQTLTTKDGKTVTISLVLVYRIVDAMKAILGVDDVDESASEVALKASVRVVTKNNFKDLLDNLSGTVETQLRNECRKLLEPMGAEVLAAGATEFAETTCFRLMQSGAAVD